MARPVSRGTIISTMSFSHLGFVSFSFRRAYYRPSPPRGFTAYTPAYQILGGILATPWAPRMGATPE